MFTILQLFSPFYGPQLGSPRGLAFPAAPLPPLAAKVPPGPRSALAALGEAPQAPAQTERKVRRRELQAPSLQGRRALSAAGYVCFIYVSHKKYEQ